MSQRRHSRNEEDGKEVSTSSNKDDGPPSVVSRKGSDVSSVASMSEGFESQAISIRCKHDTTVGGTKLAGVEIKLETNDVAQKWISIIQSMMDTTTTS